MFRETTQGIRVSNHVIPPSSSPTVGTWPQDIWDAQQLWGLGNLLLASVYCPSSTHPPHLCDSSVWAVCWTECLHSPLNYWGTTRRANEMESTQQAPGRSPSRLWPGGVLSISRGGGNSRFWIPKFLTGKLAPGPLLHAGRWPYPLYSLMEWHQSHSSL